MLQDARIKEIALEVGRANLAPQRVVDVLIQPTTTWVGEDALWITMVIPSADMPLSTGKDLVRFMRRLRERLEQEGEQRRSIPRWATPEDLADDLVADDNSEY